MNTFLTVLIFVFIGLFGLFDFQSDGLLGSIHTFDLATLALNVVFIIYLFNLRSFQNHVFNSPKKYVLYFFIFVLAVMLTMPLRGSINIFESFRVGRQFLIIPIFFLISWQCRNEKDKLFYQRLFIFISIITSIQILVNAISPELIADTFEHVRARHKFKYDFQRNDFISKSMLFPHFACLLLFNQIITKKRSGTIVIILFLLFYTASGLQGFRSYFAILTVALIFRFIQKSNIKIFFRYFRIAVVTVIFLAVADNFALNRQIYNKFISIPLDFQTSQGSTTKGRIEIDLIYSLPKFIEKPIFGWGFIHHNSEYGKAIGLRDTQDQIYRPYTLYSIDSGYLSLLNMFGVFGVIVILVFLFNFMIKQFKKSEFAFLVFASFTLIFLSLPTHGAFYSDFGLLPFLIICAISTSFKQNNQPKNE